MIRIPKNNEFKIVSEGEHIFKITKIDWNETFGKLKVYLVTENGEKHTEQYNFLINKDTQNQGAINAFGFLARAVFNDPDIEQVEPEDMVNKFFKATVIHNQVESKNDGKTLTFAQLNEKKPSAGFKTEEQQETNEDDYNLEDLF